MFERNTVIVLGAGASWHYGYPTGEALVSEIKIFAKKLLDHSDFLLSHNDTSQLITDTFDSAYNFREKLITLVRKLEQIEPLVIDYFLGHNPEIAELGKIIIAGILLEREITYLQAGINSNRPPLSEERFNDDWGRYVIHGLLDGFSSHNDLLKNQITFLTFNYDLSLERRLYEALSAIESLVSRNLPTAFLGKNRIVHMYGKITDNFLYHLDPSRREDTQQNVAFTLKTAFQAAKSIRTIAPFEKRQDEIVRLAQRTLRDAEFIYFLGYGFNRNNNRLLGLDELNNAGEKRVYFTNFGNANKVSRAAAEAFGVAPETLMGENYSTENENWNLRGETNNLRIEKSTRNVYDALAIDFDWPM